ncbi:hypothetical protein PBAC_24070 [Pedobacter glucosidilyticus]|nr:hypothetical protein [Pedobacter glucosidilyticus]KHJ37445.1 hypothetical protein PBAC_24070 [Pedobacter glucosidilyticus]
MIASKAKILVIFLFLSLPLFAQNKGISFSFAPKYQKDDLRWSIAGNSQGQNPNILSELTWNDLHSFGFNTALSIPLKRNFALEATLDKAFIFKGWANDTDYTEDNRTFPNFNMDLQSNIGNSDVYKLGLSYNFQVKNKFLKPHISYIIRNQNLYLRDESNRDLNSKYKPRWYGFNLGLELKYQFFNDFSLVLFGAYSHLNYSANATWNLIEEFAQPVSFSHKAYGFETNFATRLNYTKKQIKPFLHFQTSYASTGSGLDEAFYKNGTSAITRLNDVTFKSFFFSVGFQYSFKKVLK